MNFAKFLELSEDERLEIFYDLAGIELSWWQRTYIKCLNKWWTSMRKSNPRLRAIDLWESIYKGRF